MAEESLPELSEPVRNQLLALRMFQDEQSEREWDWEDWEALLELWDRESNWLTGAANPNSSARGIPQAMVSLHTETMNPAFLYDPKRQIEWGMDYIGRRYGSPKRALAKWLERERVEGEGWY